jgi:hypothetical protein
MITQHALDITDQLVPPSGTRQVDIHQRHQLDAGHEQQRLKTPAPRARKYTCALNATTKRNATIKTSRCTLCTNAKPVNNF